MTYVFFNYLNVTINDNGHSGYEKYFSNEYARITGKSVPDQTIPSITVEIVKRLPRANGRH